MSLFTKNADLPGLIGTTRDCSPQGKGLRKLSQGDIAVVDAPDINRAFAQQLIDARPAAVVNITSFTTGLVPNFGPQMMLDAGIILVENAGAELWRSFKDGKKGRLTEEGELFYGDKLVAAGRPLYSPEAVEKFTEAQQSMIDQMEAFFGNTTQFIHAEAPLLIDGLGIPETGTQIADRKVVVVSPGEGHRTQLKHLKNFIREFNPVLIGVDSGADTLHELGYQPDLIVGNPDGIDSAALRSGARVVLPAEPDGHAAGLERIQDLGIGAMTFPAASDSATDLALLLAEYNGAQMIVNVGAPLALVNMLAGTPEATPSAMLSRAKVGTKLVDASVIDDLYTVKHSSGWAWLWALVGIVIAVAVLILIAGTSGSGSFTDNLVDTWNNIALTVQGWVKK